MSCIFSYCLEVVVFSSCVPQEEGSSGVFYTYTDSTLTRTTHPNSIGSSFIQRDNAPRHIILKCPQWAWELLKKHVKELKVQFGHPTPWAATGYGTTHWTQGIHCQHLGARHYGTPSEQSVSMPRQVRTVLVTWDWPKQHQAVCFNIVAKSFILTLINSILIKSLSTICICLLFQFWLRLIQYNSHVDSTFSGPFTSDLNPAGVMYSDRHSERKEGEREELAQK